LSEWCERGNGWCNPYEAADVMLMSFYAHRQDWDGLLHNGVFKFPQPWGHHVTGTVGGDQWDVIPFAFNAMPQVFCQTQQAALLFQRAAPDSAGPAESAATGPPPTASPWHRWDRTRGVFLLNTPFTQGVAGFVGDTTPIDLGDLRIEVKTPFAVVVVSSLTSHPIKDSTRLLVTAVARAEQAGMTYRNFLKRELRSYGRPPILMEPVAVTMSFPKSWRPGNVFVSSLAADGARTTSIPVVVSSAGRVQVALSGQYRSLQFEVRRDGDSSH
jgi:hypothetical protein